jgi:hypothetical protein
VEVYARGSAKKLRWEVKAYTITGMSVINSGIVGSTARPPSREAEGLRRSIEQKCAPTAGGSE